MSGNVLPAVWGELATNSAIQRGLAGVVIFGAARDTGDIRALGFPLFCTLISPTAGEAKGFGEIGVPIRIAGVAVSPGDWIIGDDDGVCVIPKRQGRRVHQPGHGCPREGEPHAGGDPGGQHAQPGGLPVALGEEVSRGTIEPARD